MTGLPWVSSRALACRILLAGQPLDVQCPAGLVRIQLDGMRANATCVDGAGFVVDLDAFDVIAALHTVLYDHVGGLPLRTEHTNRYGQRSWEWIPDGEPLARAAAEDILWKACALAAPEWMPAPIDEELVFALGEDVIRLEQALLAATVTVRRACSLTEMDAARRTASAASAALETADDAFDVAVHLRARIIEILRVTAPAEAAPITTRVPSNRPMPSAT